MWYSCYGTTFNDDLAVTAFGLSVLLRNGDEGFGSYFTTGRENRANPHNGAADSA